ncbi:non-hydrolyzing UDP-N-acetylglucosamine 2-epimerase [Roseivirga sp. BDSF3-8]|uniref:non-hydrolyzing UDP-N-acetylglucosamine 2-epimerase n=1 Tax=Roseivirga sp. BDSF3-8 TaxID=3241598 RepID=UPI0035318CF8
MVSITFIAGARPNFMKIAPLIHAVKKQQKEGEAISYRLIHTGQHYDEKLSETFFRQLNIPHPDANLEVGSGSHAVQTANIMIRFEEELLKNPADVVVVVGDVNSTLACSIVAKKLHKQVVHVEAGIRSFDLSMPEEINRMVTDSIADHFFTTSEFANKNLKKAGIEADRIHYVGNTMIDTLLANQDRLRKPEVADELHLEENNYFVLTLHRPANVDEGEKLAETLRAIMQNAGGKPVVFPVHPRTASILGQTGLKYDNLHFIDPLGYLEFIYLIKGSFGVITDSGGIQEETTVLQVPCLTLRDNTERPETVDIGTNVLVGTAIPDIEREVKNLVSGNRKTGRVPELWDGEASDRIIRKLIELYGEE